MERVLAIVKRCRLFLQSQFRDWEFTLFSYVVRRVVALGVTVLASSFAIFGGLYLAPGSPVSFLVGRESSPEAIQAIIKQYRLDDPFFVRYLRWLGDIFQGDMGQSLIYRESVSSLIAQRAGTTFVLVLFAATLTLVFGIGVGIFVALRPGRWDNTLMMFLGALVGVPSFVVAILLIAVFSVSLNLFPVYGAGEGFLDKLWHLTLPALSLALGGTALIARITRSAFKTELLKDYVSAARGRGLSERYIVFNHVLRNAAIPISTIAGLLVASLVAGTVIIGQAFALNDMGAFLVQSVERRDYPVVQAICLILVVTFAVVNLGIDLLYGVIDPRVRLAGARGAR